MSIRFDYVRYDPAHTEMQNEAKALVLQLEYHIDQLLPGRPRGLAHTALEECYMWIGKAIRDDQVALVGDSIDKPERGDI